MVKLKATPLARSMISSSRTLINSKENSEYNDWQCANEFSVNNYSDGLNPTTATLYIDDAEIATDRIWEQSVGMSRRNTKAVRGLNIKLMGSQVIFSTLLRQPGHFQIGIFNVSGRQLGDFPLIDNKTNGYSISINRKQLPEATGTYIAKLRHPKGQIVERFLLKK